MTTTAPPDVELRPIDGEPRPLHAWLTTFHLVLVALDPFTNESAWIVDRSRPARCRGNLLERDLRTPMRIQ